MNLGWRKRLHTLINRIIDLFWDGKTLGHSYRNGDPSEAGIPYRCCFIAAAISMLYENDESWEKSMNEMAAYVESFRDGEQMD